GEEAVWGTARRVAVGVGVRIREGHIQALEMVKRGLGPRARFSEEVDAAAEAGFEVGIAGAENSARGAVRSDGQRRAGLHSEDAGELPIVDDCADHGIAAVES